MNSLEAKDIEMKKAQHTASLYQVALEAPFSFVIKLSSYWRLLSLNELALPE